MQKGGFIHFFIDRIGNQHPEHKGEYRVEVAQAEQPIFLQKRGAHQHNIAGLRICKHMTPYNICIGVLKTAAKCQKGAENKGFGHLLLTESTDKEVLPQNSIFSHNKCVKINT